MKKIYFVFIFYFYFFFWNLVNAIWDPDFNYIDYKYGEKLDYYNVLYSDIDWLIFEKNIKIDNIYIVEEDYTDILAEIDSKIENFIYYDFYWVSKYLKRNIEVCVDKFEYWYWLVESARREIFSQYTQDYINQEIAHLAKLDLLINDEYNYINEKFDRNVIYTDEIANQYNNLYYEMKDNYLEFHKSKQKLEIVFKTLDKFYNYIYLNSCIQEEEKLVNTTPSTIEIVSKISNKSATTNKSVEQEKIKTQEVLLKEEFSRKADIVMEKLELKLWGLDYEKKLEMYKLFMLKFQEFSDKSNNENLKKLIEILIEKIKNYVLENS